MTGRSSLSSKVYTTSSSTISGTAAGTSASSSSSDTSGITGASSVTVSVSEGSGSWISTTSGFSLFGAFVTGVTGSGEGRTGSSFSTVIGVADSASISDSVRSLAVKTFPPVVEQEAIRTAMRITRHAFFILSFYICISISKRN